MTASAVHGRLATLILLAIFLAAVSPLAAAAPDQEASPEETSMQGEPGLGPVEARRLRFLFWGYAVIWILLGIYMLSIGLRLRTVRRELARLRERLEARGSRPSA